MYQTDDNIYRILQKIVDGEDLTTKEGIELDDWQLQSPERQWLLQQLKQPETYKEAITRLYSIDRNVDQNLARYLQLIKPVKQVHRIHFLKTAWIRYAAAIIILIGIGTYIYITNQKEKPSVTQNNPAPVQNDVAPGGNKAILTLADGSKIVLDSAKKGELAKEENATITKTADGKIVYVADEKLGNRILFNTMATPRGGQYELTLPDGTQVWLNAESSITYPTAFTGKERRVNITGEAYFEVAKDKAKPFIVSVEGKQDIEVLGTHFNVNAYKDEETIKTTLLEGSVRITLGAAHAGALAKAVHTSLLLKPGQQGQLQDNRLSLASSLDVEQVMAWKNGMFRFNRASMEEVMRQLERWYDVQVIYEKEIPKIRFAGEMQRSLRLSQVLAILEKMEVKFRIEGKKLIVQ